MSKIPIRVMHCPEMVGGNPQSLARVEREIGLASRAIALQANRFNFPSDEVLCPANCNLALRELKRLPLLARALRDFDLIHFNFGLSTMPQYAPGLNDSLPRRLFGLYARLLELRDLPLLKRAGKGIVVTYQGDDARQGDYSLANFAISLAQEVEPDYYPPAADRRKRERIARFARYADRIYALNPDLLHVLPPGSRFLPYANIDPREWLPVGGGGNEVPVLLHAPSHRGAKGTRFVLDAVNRLQAEGVALEFVLVEGLPHAEARRLYGRADLLVDQLLAGWYGGLAFELMALGKPAISYIREEDMRFIPAGMREQLPIINANPATIYDVLKHWLTTGRAELAERGRQSRAYVERWHDPLRIAADLKADYEQILSARR